MLARCIDDRFGNGGILRQLAVEPPVVGFAVNADEVDIIEGAGIIGRELGRSQDILGRLVEHADRIIDQFAPALGRVLEIGDIADELLGDLMHAGE